MGKEFSFYARLFSRQFINKPWEGPARNDDGKHSNSRTTMAFSQFPELQRPLPIMRNISVLGLWKLCMLIQGTYTLTSALLYQ